ncbi:MAG: hypothetical protein WC107_02055 [Patescibacteria group bacterium]
MSEIGVKFDRYENSELIGEGTSAKAYLVEPNCDAPDEELVCKVLKPESHALETYHGTLEEKSLLMNRVTKILKRHLGDYLLDGFFTVGLDEKGHETIMMLQEPISGKRLRDIWPRSEGILQQHNDIKDRVEGLKADKEFQELPDFVNGNAQNEFTYDENIMVLPNGKLIIYDW